MTEDLRVRLQAILHDTVYLDLELEGAVDAIELAFKEDHWVRVPDEMYEGLLANVAPAYRNETFEADEIHPAVVVDHKPPEFKSNVTKLTQADLGKRVFIDMSHETPGTMAMGEILSFDDRSKTAEVLVTGMPHSMPYARLQLLRFAAPRTKL